MVADANSELPITTLDLDAFREARLTGELPDRVEQSAGRGLVELLDGLPDERDGTDRVHHRTESGAKLPLEHPTGTTPRLAARLSSTEDGSLVPQRLQRTVEELGRAHNSTSPNPPRGDLDRLT